MKSQKKKNLSGNKTNRDQLLRMAKSKSHFVLPVKKRSISDRKQKQKDKDRHKDKQRDNHKPQIKKAESKKKIPRISTIEERISNIRKGFQQLERRIIHSQQPDIKRLMESATRSIRTRTYQKSPGREKSHSKSKEMSGSKDYTKSKGKKISKCSGHCVYSKAVYNLISIINYQKIEIESLRSHVLASSRR